MADAEIRDSDHVTSVVDIAAGLVLAAMAGVALFWLVPNYIGSGGSEHDVGPAFFPKLTAWVVLVLSLALIITKAVGFKMSGAGRPGRSIVLEIIVWAVVSVLAVLGLTKVGFLFTAPLLVAIGALACGYRKWWIIAVLAVAFPAVVNQVAWLVFSVDLP